MVSRRSRTRAKGGEDERDARPRPRSRRDLARRRRRWRRFHDDGTHPLLAQKLEGLAPLDLALHRVDHLLRGVLDLIHRLLELLHVLLVLLLDELDGLLRVFLRLLYEVPEPAGVLVAPGRGLPRPGRPLGGVRGRPGLLGVRHGARAVRSHRRVAPREGGVESETGERKQPARRGGDAAISAQHPASGSLQTKLFNPGTVRTVSIYCE